MPEILAPGVFIEETPSRNRIIQAASTSTAAMVGMTQRGPVGTPELVTSLGDYNRVFGGKLHPLEFLNGRDSLPYAAEGFFRNSGSRLYVVRIIGAAASRSTLRMFADTTAQGEALFPRNNTAAPETTVPVSPVMTVHAHWPGAWGNDLRITTSQASIVSTTSSMVSAAGTDTITLGTVSGLFPGSVITVGTAPNTETVEIQSVNISDGIVTLANTLIADVPAGAGITSQEFTLLIERIKNDNTVESEIFEQLSLASEHPRYAPDIVGSFDSVSNTPSKSGGSELVRLEDNANSRVLPLVHNVGLLLAGGDDDVAGVNDQTYIGNSSVDPNARTGIQAMENEPGISIVAVPGRTSVDLQKALIAHCEKMRYRFAILDTPLGSNAQAARIHRQNFDTTHAAIYYPGLVVVNSFDQDGDRITIPASGHVAGIYARTDTTRGVHKAPANEIVSGILNFETVLTRAEQILLNPIAVNCMRDFRTANRGLRVFGARVATSDPEWKYINVRRLQLFIEQSIDLGLRWVIFEPNSEPLWNSVRQSVIDFLITVWRTGALAGQRQEEAFFVNVGFNDTMTQNDVDSGRMIVHIGIAPIKPAEFIITRISQMTLDGSSPLVT